MKRGDVVIVDYPYSDAGGSKVRPALVVQADDKNNVLDDTIIALITSRMHRGVDTHVVAVPIRSLQKPSGDPIP